MLYTLNKYNKIQTKIELLQNYQVVQLTFYVDKLCNTHCNVEENKCTYMSPFEKTNIFAILKNIPTFICKCMRTDLHVLIFYTHIVVTCIVYIIYLCYMFI